MVCYKLVWIMDDKINELTPKKEPIEALNQSSEDIIEIPNSESIEMLPSMEFGPARPA